MSDPPILGRNLINTDAKRLEGKQVTESDEWADFQVYLARYFVDGIEEARTRIDKLLAQGNYDQIKKKRRALTLAEQVKPAVEEIESHIDGVTTHDFYVNFWRIEITIRASRNLNELPLHAIAVKHGIKIEHVAPFRNAPLQRCLKVYPSSRPRFANKV
jgi:hypothetical protein